ncbi:MAG: hypothetical protein HOY69_28765 [Streptomyces sp.]|nr:hypothetical protein [Streptomyces sp.]
MSAQPDRVLPLAAVPAPTATAQLLQALRADRRAGRWVPAAEADWTRALEDAGHSYSLSPLHDVVRT